MRFPRKANGSAQLHHGLIEVAGTGSLKKRLRLAPDLGLLYFASVQSLDHSFHVAVHHGHRFIENNAGDGSRRVASDPREITQRCGGHGELPLVFGDDFLCASVQHARPAVVTETAPGGKNRFERSCGQGCEAGKEFQKDAVVFKHRCYARLLQHDFRQPNAVGVAGSAPGKIAPGLVVPTQKRPAKPDNIYGAGKRRGKPRLYRNAGGRFQTCARKTTSKLGRLGRMAELYLDSCSEYVG